MRCAESEVKMPSIFVLSITILSLSFDLEGCTGKNVNNRPIIGILTEPTSSAEYGEEYIEATYVHYLESAGARVVPVRGKQPRKYYEKLFKNINGVLFPGGGANLRTSPYAKSGRYMYDMALEANDNGDYFPIWGTCLGFELLTVLTANRNYLGHTHTENVTLPLMFAKGFEKSRLFSKMPKQLVEHLADEAITQNNHYYSLLLKDYRNISALNDFYRLISTSVGMDKKEFVSTFEAYNYPFYGVQWHPEKSIFLWRTDQAINHDYHSIKVSQYMTNFFVQEARKSFHHYDSTDEEAHAVIENAVRVFIPDFRVDEKFYFNYTNNHFINRYGLGSDLVS